MLLALTNQICQICCRGFKRAAGQSVPPNTVAYYHNCFQRDQPELLKGMTGGKKKDVVAKDDPPAPLQADLTSLSGATHGSARPGASNMAAAPGLAGSAAGLGPYGLLSNSFLAGGVGFGMQGLGGAQAFNPLDQELRLQAFLASQQNADLARQQQQARLMAAELASDQAAAASELRFRALAGPAYQPSTLDLTSRMLMAASAPGPMPLPPVGAGPAGLNYSHYDPHVLQLLLERQRQQEQDPRGRP